MFDGAAGIFRAFGGRDYSTRQTDGIRAVTEQIKDDGEVSEDTISALKAIDEILGTGAQFLRDKKFGHLILMLALSVILHKCSGDDKPITIDLGHQTVNVTNVYNYSPGVEVSNSVLYYPHNPKDYKDGKYTDPSGSRAEPEKHKP